jgi:hypothetical protein
MELSTFFSQKKNGAKLAGLAVSPFSNFTRKQTIYHVENKLQTCDCYPTRTVHHRLPGFFPGPIET